MRESKFRYWDSYHKEMHYPICAFASNLTLPAAELINEYPDDFSFAWMEALECTGLKDRNGNEIWEGDIVKWFVNNRIVIAPVIFECGSFCMGEAVNEDYGNVYNDWLRGEYEIIGNIYENPELLEKSE